MNLSDIHIAHSYERVMPGSDYLASITDFREYLLVIQKIQEMCVKNS